MSAVPPTTSRARARLTLAAVCLAGAVLPASLTGSSIALPDIGRDLSADLAPLQWVVNAYNLTFASVMLASGGLADRLGRRRMFTIGAALFALCSFVSAFAGNIYLLDVARGLAGVGAAAVLTAGSALLASTFSGPALGKAFGLLGSCFGAGLAFGPSTAGFLSSAFGWQAVFISHGVLTMVAMLGIGAMRESSDPNATKIDAAGTTTFTAGLFCLALAFVEGPQRGWGDVLVLALLAGFVGLMITFVVVEKRQDRPMFDLGLFTQRRFLAICYLPVVVAFGFVCLLVLLPSYFVSASGLSIGRVGLVMMALTVPVLIFPAVAGALSKRFSIRTLLVASLLLIAGGGAWLTVIEPGIALLTVVGPLVLIGTGMGISAGLLDAAAVSSVEPERAGMAAGMFNTMRLAGETVAIVTMSALLLGLTQSRLASAPNADALANKVVGGDLAGAAGGNEAFATFLANGYTGALHVVLWVIAGICLVSAPVVAVLLAERPAAVTPEPAPEPALSR